MFRPRGCRSLTGAWIETAGELLQVDKYVVAPLRGRGLKLIVKGVEKILNPVAPLRGRGLKLVR